MAWRWSVEGTAMTHGTIQRVWEASGVRNDKISGEVLDWLTNGPESPLWEGGLDTGERFTITIEPAEELG